MGESSKVEVMTNTEIANALTHRGATQEDLMKVLDIKSKAELMRRAKAGGYVPPQNSKLTDDDRAQVVADIEWLANDVGMTYMAIGPAIGRGKSWASEAKRSGGRVNLPTFRALRAFVVKKTTEANERAQTIAATREPRQGGFELTDKGRAAIQTPQPHLDVAAGVRAHLKGIALIDEAAAHYRHAASNGAAAIAEELLDVEAKLLALKVAVLNGALGE